MTKFMRIVVFSFALMPLTACENFSEIEARIGVSNGSDDTIALILNNEEIGEPVGPGESKSFIVKISVPNRRGGPIYPEDEYLIANLSVYNFRLARPSRPVGCTVGGKVITSVYYDVWGESPHEYAEVFCRHQY